MDDDTTASGADDDDLPGGSPEADILNDEKTKSATPDPAAKPPAKRGGRLLAAFSLLIALAAAGAAGYVYYRLIYLDPLPGLDERVGGLESRLPALTRELSEVRQAQSNSLETLAAEQRASLAAAQQSMIKALNEVSTEAPPAPREWKLAEVEYLLRIANNRILMERDVDSALKLLRAADAILLELDDFTLFGVRAALADEIQALRGVRGNDVQGIFLRLEAIKGELAKLPLDVPEYLSRRVSPAPAEPETFWEALRRQLSGYLRVRRFEGATKPLLAPEEAVYLDINLRLMLEQAQLAALRRQQVVYEQSISSARDWLEQYLDPDNADVKQVVGELESLLEIQLDQPLPDISGSLSALQEVRRSPG